MPWRRGLHCAFVSACHRGRDIVSRQGIGWQLLNKRTNTRGWILILGVKLLCLH
jgi:hypothetical protein